MLTVSLFLLVMESRCQLRTFGRKRRRDQRERERERERELASEIVFRRTGGFESNVMSRKGKVEREEKKRKRGETQRWCSM